MCVLYTFILTECQYNVNIAITVVTLYTQDNLSLFPHENLCQTFFEQKNAVLCARILSVLLLKTGNLDQCKACEKNIKKSKLTQVKKVYKSELTHKSDR